MCACVCVCVTELFVKELCDNVVCVCQSCVCVFDKVPCERVVCDDVVCVCESAACERVARVWKNCVCVTELRVTKGSGDEGKW